MSNEASRKPKDTGHPGQDECAKTVELSDSDLEGVAGGVAMAFSPPPPPPSPGTAPKPVSPPPPPPLFSPP